MLAECSAEGCANRAATKGLCLRHYNLMNRYGSLDERPVYYIHAAKVEWIYWHLSWNDDQCLIWPFPTRKMAMGYIAIGGMRYQSVSRAMCILAHGNPPTPTHQAAHRCGRFHLGCVNPRHLRWATPYENQHDRVEHGTVMDGELNPSSKLTEADVWEIKYGKFLGITDGRVATALGVSRATIWNVRSGRTWRNSSTTPAGITALSNRGEHHD